MAKPDHTQNTSPDDESKEKSLDFIRTIIAKDNESGKHGGKVATRFPPEPNGYLHIGHAKSICLNFGIAGEHEKGTCNLRFDDTNPTKEDVEYVDSIMEDVRWMGFGWNELHYASDYFEKLYEFAVELIKAGKAYVCDLSPEEIRAYRGTLKEPGKNSPYRDRTPEENLDLFQRMRAGEFEDGSRVLRAKIDMAAPNLIMRDPTLYRIRRAHHHRTGDKWLIYPMYDFTHCLSDSMEGITHSICTLEFENNRALYDWVLDNVNAPCHPQQIEFARLNLSHTVLSKRKLIQLVEKGLVNGWSDPRMPTISGLRRRGYPPEALRNFCDRIGVAKRDSMVDMALLEFCVREHLNEVAPRVMGVLNPLKVVITNYPEGQSEELDCPLHPTDPSQGNRMLPFSGELYIEREDFMEDPPKKFFRLSPGKEVRLRYAYFITCQEVIKDENGEIVELRCTYDPATKGGDAPDGRKVKATLHWVSAPHACTSEVRLYEHLFTEENPNDVEEGKDFTDYINPDSLKVLKDCKVEPSLANAGPGYQCQFERMGYFCVDSVDPDTGMVTFNRTVTLRDQWAKIQKSQQPQPKKNNKQKKKK
ncbi:Glutaminyl-tRNA synthetase [Desulfatibacillum aliphaticivorans]|uniref:Glutamine--tRNA ligase n=1 Tax=Desulfatibacillum aliphaticivorans TaxID=218208 RepID=B8FLI8_DESAL|nr:glutamine--tRNA ligase/YqeY domain fusion protein [Desulfatibacillum aliphaticivorans]ACL05134.1 Glutaminyl-tRNA synthetase [Desulfatibacillum aliphaticivorans]